MTGRQCESGVTGSSARLGSCMSNQSSGGSRKQENRWNTENNYTDSSPEKGSTVTWPLPSPPRPVKSCLVPGPEMRQMDVILTNLIFWQVVKFSWWIYDSDPHFGPFVVWPGVNKTSLPSSGWKEKYTFHAVFCSYIIYTMYTGESK